MTLTKEVDAAPLRTLELRRGDVLRVLADDGQTLTLEIERPESASPASPKCKVQIPDFLARIEANYPHPMISAEESEAFWEEMRGPY